MKQPFIVRRRHARAIAIGSIALAAGGVLLWRAPRGLAARPGVTTLQTSTRGAHVTRFTGPGLSGQLALAQGAILAGGERQLYATLQLDAAQRAIEGLENRPVAIAIALDVSGSMQGEKIAQARNAVAQLVSQMRDGDQIALVTYSDSPAVLQPLATVRDVRANLTQIIANIEAMGGTNIPSGLDQASAQLQAAAPGVVRRVILVSDGQDGSGVPIDNVRSNVRSRSSSGVTMSALGIGADYDERFLSSVADAGHGNYEFLRDGSQLQGLLARELRQAASTVVDRAVAEVRLPDGWTVRQAFGVDVDGRTGVVRVPVGSLFAGDHRRFVFDLAVRAGAPGPVGNVSVRVNYRDVAHQHDASSESGALALVAVDSAAAVAASTDMAIFADAESTAIAGRQVLAVQAWRDGRNEEAERITRGNVDALRQLAARAPSAAIGAQLAEYGRDQAAFGSVSAGSEQGRAYGLQSVWANRARTQRAGVPTSQP